MSDPHIVIVTGWRGATADVHGELIGRVLRRIDDEWGVVLLRHGKCPFGGVDLIAHNTAGDLGWKIQEFPPTVRNGVVAGPARNRRMCTALPLAHELVAFPGPGSRGTYDCVKCAGYAGIPFSGYPLQDVPERELSTPALLTPAVSVRGVAGWVA